ncbi:uncharacterized protein [Rutidosis leptorrhynchoides]|uniref:uncharacterized protein n=1 Tax=Rutidosis leptorrhynchoides TaxID=125765 RepID=UPI003A996225
MSKKRKAKCFIFKADFEKAFDNVRWKYLFDIMGRMGFGIKWRKWIDSCLRSASISVLVNGSPTREFNLQKGIRQGDPLSPYLFIIASEGLNILVNIAVRDGLVRGVGIGDNRIRISHLQFADDTIFFGEWNNRNVSNVHKTLACFEKVSGLKINMSKSLLYGIGIPQADIVSMALKFGCEIGKMPFTYLGMPIGQKSHKKMCGVRSGHYIWIGGTSFKDRFPRLFRLETNQDVYVSERIQGTAESRRYAWSWSREPSGRILGELQQISLMINNNATLGEGPAVWEWTLDSTGSYNSRLVAEKIDELLILRSGHYQETMKNNYIPQKIDSILCPMCNDYIETVEHAIILCKVAKDIWKAIYNWWGSNPPDNASLSNHFSGSGRDNLTGGNKKIWQAVEWVTG